MEIKQFLSGYFLSEACENTFLLFDCLAVSSLNETFFHWVHQYLIQENRDDALILVDGKMNGDNVSAQMLLVGFDGNRDGFCGNGARACAAYLFSKYKNYKNFFLITNRGKHRLLRYNEKIYAIELPPLRFGINNVKFIAKPELFQKEGNFYYLPLENQRFYYAEPIESHLVVYGNFSDQELFQLGQFINSRKDIFPLGITLNSCFLLKENTLRIKTYERCLQRLTRSCGTGSLSCAALSLKNKMGKVDVINSGGLLNVSILKNKTVELKGPAIIGDYKISYKDTKVGIS